MLVWWCYNCLMKREESPLPPAVRRCLAEMLPESVGVVAVSGGPDSMGLLRALLLETTGKLVVAHLNHQLRGEDSDADEAFVRELHGRLGASDKKLLPFQCKRLDVRVVAKGGNLESVARRLRYEWLVSVARETGATWVATGH